MANRKKYSINITAIFVAVIIAVAAVAVVIVGTGSSWFKNADIKTWFGGWGKQKPAAVLAITSDGAELKDGSVCDMSRGIVYLFSTYTEQTADGEQEKEYIPDGEITMTAEISNAFIQGRFDWSASFKDGTPADEYVSATPIVEYSNTAKVKFLKSFSEQIIITAALQGSDNVDTCTVDCLQDVTYNVSEANFGGNDFGDGIEFFIAYNHVAGTVKSDDFKLNYLRLELDSDFINTFKSYLKFDVTVKACYLSAEGWTGDSFAYGPGSSQTGVNFESGLLFEQSNFITDFDSYDQEHKEAIYFAFYQAHKTHTYNVLMSFSIDYLYAGCTVSNYEETDINNGLMLTGVADGCDIQPNVNLNKNIIF